MPNGSEHVCLGGDRKSPDNAQNDAIDPKLTSFDFGPDPAVGQFDTRSTNSQPSQASERQTVHFAGGSLTVTSQWRALFGAWRRSPPHYYSIAAPKARRI